MGMLLSFGHGYSARALSDLLLAEGGWTVAGTTRSAEKAGDLAQTGVEPIIWPGADMRPALEAATHLLISAGPGPDGDPVLAALGDDIARIAPRLTWCG